MEEQTSEDDKFKFNMIAIPFDIWSCPIKYSIKIHTKTTLSNNHRLINWNGTEKKPYSKIIQNPHLPANQVLAGPMTRLDRLWPWPTLEHLQLYSLMLKGNIVKRAKRLVSQRVLRPNIVVGKCWRLASLIVGIEQLQFAVQASGLVGREDFSANQARCLCQRMVLLAEKIS